LLEFPRGEGIRRGELPRELRVRRRALPEELAEGVQVGLGRRRDRSPIGQRAPGDEGVDRLVVGEGRRGEERSEQKSALHCKEASRARSRGRPPTAGAPYRAKSRPPQRTPRALPGNARRNTAASSSENGCGSSGSSTISGSRRTTSSSVTRG